MNIAVCTFLNLPKPYWYLKKIRSSINYTNASVSSLAFATPSYLETKALNGCRNKLKRGISHWPCWPLLWLPWVWGHCLRNVNMMSMAIVRMHTMWMWWRPLMCSTAEETTQQLIQRKPLCSQNLMQDFSLYLHLTILEHMTINLLTAYINKIVSQRGCKVCNFKDKITFPCCMTKKDMQILYYKYHRIFDLLNEVWK